MTLEWRARFGIAACALAMQACGGGLPLLHPVQPLPSGVSSLAMGMGSHWVGGQASREIDEARLQIAAAQGGSFEIAPAAAVAAAVWSPGLFPWMSMRMGLGSESEAGVAYTGRHARMDARHALIIGRWAFSVGLGAGMGLAHPSDATTGGTTTFGSSEPLSGLDTSNVRSFGVDVPFVVGWHSSADVARVWIGIRPSYERGYGSLTLGTQATPARLDFRSDVFSLSGLAGLAMGLRPLFIALELGFGDSRAHGQLLGNSTSVIGSSATVSAFSFTPAAALIWELH